MHKRSKAIVEKLEVEFSEVKFSRKTGEYFVQQGFFYRMGGSTERLVERVKKVFPEAEITKAWECYRSWPGRSYWEVRFKVTEPVVTSDISTAKE